MSRTDAAPEVHDLANELGVGSSTPVEGILDYCRNRIDRWVAEAGGVTNIDALEGLVAQRLQMVFEEIRTDEDFDRLREVYAKGKKDYVFAAMRTKFDGGDNPTYGALFQRKNVTADAPDRFVAVIDCRGSKLARRFFTRWHEIAHRLTTHADMPEPVYRSELDPIERLMDEIAGHVGFYEPLFAPAFREAHEGKPLLKFETVESVMRSRFPAASFQSTLFACIRRLSTPVLYVEAAIAHKKDVKKRIEDTSPQLFGAEPPPPGELRAVKVNPNKAAQQQRFSIPANMRVPVGCVIARMFAADPLAEGSGSEDLSQWESRGKTLERRAVVVEARRVPERVIAIVQPLDPVHHKDADEAITILVRNCVGFTPEDQLEDLIVISPSYRAGFGDDVDTSSPAGFSVHYLRLTSAHAAEQHLSGVALPDLPAGSIALSGSVLWPEGLPPDPLAMGSPAIESLDDALSLVATALATPGSVLNLNGFSRNTQVYIWRPGRPAKRAIAPK